MFTAMNFITDMRATFSFSGYPTTIAFVSGWTASGNVAGAGYEHPMFNGNFGISSAPDEPRLLPRRVVLAARHRRHHGAGGPRRR